MGEIIDLQKKELTPVIRFTGIFDFDGLYKLMVNWFLDRNYDFYEPLYKDKGMDIGREVEIEWETEKEIDEYFKYQIDIYFHLWEVQPVEVIIEGEKKMLTKAKIEIRLKPKVVADYENRWDRSEFRKKLRDFYLTYVINKKIELQIVEPLYNRMYELHTLIKDYLKMSTKGSAY